MMYRNEAFINLTLVIQPETVFDNCSFVNCTLVIFDDSVKTKNCIFDKNTQVIMARLLP